MNNLDPKLAAVLAHVEKDSRKEIFSTKLTAIGYGLLVIFVFAYTNWVIIKLNEVATPDNISALLKSQIEQLLPRAREEGLKRAKQLTPLLADHLAALPAEAIPVVEGFLKENLDQQLDQHLAKVKNDILAHLTFLLDDNAKDINLSAKTIKDRSAANGLAILLVKELEMEMEKSFFNQYRLSCSQMRDQVDALRIKSIGQMNKKELVEHNLIINWVFLTENGEINTAYGNVLGKISGAYEFITNSVQDKLEPESVEFPE